MQQEYRAGQLPKYWQQLIKAALKRNRLTSGITPSLPQGSLHCSDVLIDRKRVLALHHIAGWDGPVLHPLTPHLLAFELQMQLLTSKTMPFPMLGLVHVSNRIEQYRPLSPDDALSISVNVQNLQEHARGWQYELQTAVEQGAETCWSQRSTFLVRVGTGGKPLPQRTPKRPVALMSNSQNFKFPEDTGRRYAAVSKDYNPIHLYPLTAKLLGFSKPIAHGMFSKARAIGALETQLGDSFFIETEFKQPVFLPATLHFSYRLKDSEYGEFILVDQSMTRLHMQGHWGPLK